MSQSLVSCDAMESLDVDVLRGRARPDELDQVHCCSLSTFSADVLMAVVAAMHTRPAAPRQRLAALGHHRGVGIEKSTLMANASRLKC